MHLLAGAVPAAGGGVRGRGGQEELTGDTSAAVQGGGGRRRGGRRRGQEPAGSLGPGVQASHNKEGHYRKARRHRVGGGLPAGTAVPLQARHQAGASRRGGGGGGSGHGSRGVKPGRTRPSQANQLALPCEERLHAAAGLGHVRLSAAAARFFFLWRRSRRDADALARRGRKACVRVASADGDGEGKGWKDKGEY